MNGFLLICMEKVGKADWRCCKLMITNLQRVLIPTHRVSLASRFCFSPEASLTHPALSLCQQAASPLFTQKLNALPVCRQISLPAYLPSWWKVESASLPHWDCSVLDSSLPAFSGTLSTDDLYWSSETASPSEPRLSLSPAFPSCSLPIWPYFLFSRFCFSLQEYSLLAFSVSCLPLTLEPRRNQLSPGWFWVGSLVTLLILNKAFRCRPHLHIGPELLPYNSSLSMPFYCLTCCSAYDSGWGKEQNSRQLMKPPVIWPVGPFASVFSLSSLLSSHSGLCFSFLNALCSLRSQGLCICCFLCLINSPLPFVFIVNIWAWWSFPRESLSWCPQQGRGPE